MEKKNYADIIFDILNYLFMLIIVFVMLYPFIYILFYSLSDVAKLNGSLIFYPKGFNIKVYKDILKNPEILNGLIISVLRTTIGALFMIVFTSMAAFSTSRKEMAGVGFFRKFFVFPMYINAGIIPLYVLMKSLHLTGTFAVYILPLTINAFSLVLVRTYIESLPEGLHDAAIIDGANDLVLFYRVIFPLCMPIIAAVGLFAAVQQWNYFFDTQIYNSMKPNLYPLQYVLYTYLFTQQSKALEQLQNANAGVLFTPQSIKMAITVITIVPIIAVYPFLQKYFVSGLLVGSIKG